jgi:hypothetical protein
MVLYFGRELYRVRYFKGSLAEFQNLGRGVSVKSFI